MRFDPTNPLKIGTRGSPLALAQAHETRTRLGTAFDLPVEAFEIVVITTTGDRIQDRALREIGGKGLFTKEIEDALLSGGIDVAVHSTKDMPTQQPDGLILPCFLPREDERDAFISLEGGSLSDLPAGALVGTSSLRRRAQLLNRFPHLEVVEFRGNVQTRLRKLEEGVARATFLAMAGLNRLGADVPCTAISVDEMLPAVAQGTIGIECREDDAEIRAMLDAIHCAQTGLRLSAERAFLAALDGSCETPLAGLAEIEEGDRVRLRGELLRPDGSEVIRGDERASLSDAAELGAELGARLKAEAGPDFLKV